MLKAEATRAEISKLCQEAKAFGFASVCVQPFRIAQAFEELENTDVKVCTVIGFPLGANRAEVKALETVRAMTDGAREIDMVLNIGALKDGNFAVLENEIKAVVKATQNHTVKVILETSLLLDAEIIKACQIAEQNGAHFVKTSTGFGRSGASVEHVRLMRQSVGQSVHIKASGGIRDLATLQAMVEAGATRIGTSHGVSIVQGQSSMGDY